MKIRVLLALLFCSLGCTSQPTPLVVQEPLKQTPGSKLLLQTEMNQALPTGSAELQRILTYLKAPSGCAALYQLALGKGLDQTLQSWLRKDLNFSLDCLPASAQAWVPRCIDTQTALLEREGACQRAIGLTRAHLVTTLLEKDDRPQVQLIKLSHQLYALQDFTPDQASRVLALSDALLARKPSELDAHLLRARALTALASNAKAQAALANSVRWLKSSTEKRHRLAALEVERQTRSATR